MIIDESNYLEHYGVLRKSGRYPWGSSGPENANNKSFLDYVNELRGRGLSEKEIATAFDTSVASLRAARSIARNEEKQAEINTAQRLKDKAMSNVEISKKMYGTASKESTVRALLAPGTKEKLDRLNATSNLLKEHVDAKQFIDIGSGVEQHVGVTSTEFNNAVAKLREEGYEVHSVPIPQLGTGKDTNTKVLAPPNTTWGEVMKNRYQIKQIVDYSDVAPRTDFGLLPPISINPNRVAVLYAADGGSMADGVIYIRPNVKDVSIGENSYAQVRLAVGSDHYLKGMAVYKDDLPAGIDIVFNTNKDNTGNKLDAMKKYDLDINGNVDKDNPFGAKISRQIKEIDVDGNEHLTSVMNLVNEEGDWSTWSKTLSTQMLSKQSPKLAKTQLDMTYEHRVKEFERISNLTNPTVRKSLLEKFGDETDAAAVQLDAAALSSRQGWHTILPVSTMPPTQVYAPRFRDGERVVLIRYPHAGKFEIPELVVNNNQKEAKKLLGNAKDAIGIHHSVAERLSGADFDGDTVLVIPNNGNKIKTAPALDQLKNFNPRTAFKGYEGMPKMTDRQKKIEMGGISNLITDMTLRGASADKIARAVKHSMVVIDAQKHDLNYKESAKQYSISALKQEYQGRTNAGAATLISRATSEKRIADRKPRPQAKGGPIDTVTGKREFVDTGRINYRTGVPKTIKVARLADTDDATTLFVGTPTQMERTYAEHSNKLKTLANRARKDSVNTPPLKYSPSAKKVYSVEVKSLDAKLALAIRNRPLERQAQVVANTIYRAKLDANPNMDQAMRKKISSQALIEARRRTGAEKQDIIITTDEWNAIQAGAISDSKLSQILAKANVEVVRKLATPRPEILMTSTMNTRAAAMLNSGFTRAEVADALGVSLTTLDTATNV